MREQGRWVGDKGWHGARRGVGARKAGGDMGGDGSNGGGGGGGGGMRRRGNVEGGMQKKEAIQSRGKQVLRLRGGAQTGSRAHEEVVARREHNGRGVVSSRTRTHG